MTRPLVALAPLLLLAAAQAGEFELRARPHDVVKIKGIENPVQGTVEMLDHNQLRFRKLNGEGRTWARSQVEWIKRRCTLLEAYGEATKEAGNDPRKHLRLYQACLQAKLSKQAVAELEKAVQLDPTYVPAYEKLWHESRRLNDRNLEVKWLRAAIRRNVPTTPMLLRMAQLYAELGAVDEARAPLEKALIRPPYKPAVEMKLAMLEVVLGRPDRAEGHIKELHRRAPNSPYGPLARGQLEFARGDVQKATQSFTKAAAVSDSPMADACLGAIALRQGKRATADRHYRAAAEVRPHLPAVLTGRGLILAREGKPDKAAPLLDRAMAARPARPDIVLARAYAAETARDYRRALTLYARAQQLGGADPHALAGSGRCHWELGDRAKASQCFENAHTLRRDFLPALRGLGRVALAGDPSKAVGYFGRIVRSESATAEDRVALAGALIRLKRRREAAAQLTKTGSDNVYGLIGRGFLAHDQGRDDDALAHFEAAIKLGDYGGYAADAAGRIRLARARGQWSEDFDREDDPEVRNGWIETEPPGSAISIAGRSLLIERKARTDVQLVRLARPEGPAFVSITAQAETGSEADSFVGVFVAPKGGPPVLVGRYGPAGRMAVLLPGQPKPTVFGAKVRPGKFVVGIEVDRTGTVRPLIGGKAAPRRHHVTLKELAGAAVYEVGLFARPEPDKAVQCRFSRVRIVRSK